MPTSGYSTCSGIESVRQISFVNRFTVPLAPGAFCTMRKMPLSLARENRSELGVHAAFLNLAFC